MRKYIENEIQELRNEMLESDFDTDDTKMYEEMIQDLEAKNIPYEHIEIENEITIATLKKIITQGFYNFDIYAEMEQPLENLDNGFATKKMLEMILKHVFNEKSNGSFSKSTTKLFGTRSKIRYIKSIIEDLLK